MTKLLQWLAGLALFLAVYAGLLLDLVPGGSLLSCPKCREVVLWLPINLLMAFACYSLAVIGYRVATFNDCVDAADELKGQITAARSDLKRLGYPF